MDLKEWKIGDKATHYMWNGTNAGWRSAIKRVVEVIGIGKVRLRVKDEEGKCFQTIPENLQKLKN
jgi:hypothetical protein